MPVNSFKWKHFVGEIILLNVRWYLKYPLIYKNLKEMMGKKEFKLCWYTPLQQRNRFAL